MTDPSLSTFTTFRCAATFDCASLLRGQAQADGSLRLPFQADPGLYQFSVVADASRFDWDSMYVNLNLFGNKGQRTGPWDFDITRKNVPVVPSYWVELDGHRLGLWFFQRVSVEDIKAKLLRGNMAFHLDRSGEHTLKFIPHHPVEVRWLSATLESDPDDVLEPRSFDLKDWERRCPAGRLADTSLWADLRSRLATTHAVYKEPLQKTFAWMERKLCGDGDRGAPPSTWGFNLSCKKLHPSDILPLLAAFHLEDRKETLPVILQIIDDTIQQPHWGNPREDGYGCDGDMGAATMFRALAWAFRSLRNHLGAERRARLREKLCLQGTRFFQLILLHRDYWGGSVMQDHGKISLAAFGTAALHLLGVLPEADLWTAYVIPRIRRNLRTLPRDGVIPPSSYGRLYLYLDEPAHYRDTLLALAGEDIFDQAPFRKVIDFVIAALRERDHQMLTPIWGGTTFTGGNAALNQLATKYRDGRAAYLQQALLRTPETKFHHATQEHAYYHGALWGFLTHNPEVAPVEKLPEPPPLQLYEDSGVAQYRDTRDDVTLSLSCGPWCGYNAYRRSKGPCDRLELLTGAGHFIISVGPKTLLLTPDGGYRLQSALRNCLLVDGAGRYGDIGYPMSIPSFHDRGEEIQFVRWDAAARTGWIRLDLAPAYPSAMGMAFYTRDFLLREGREIVCRDRVAFDRQHRLAWLFHGLRDEGVAQEGSTTFRLGKSPWLRIEAKPADIKLKAGIQATEVVWAYASFHDFRPFDHVQFDSTEPVETATVDFVFTWK
ncbi:MAG: DUF4962 domain-containing protein [Kiritimatiellae bacterium]|nr:DUF4962 domain-containing protein [Verrucomicrobiota bacterium]MCG2660808.1 DUF4962 domain-containing protein [Kiritimatiellia bacterium]